MSTQLNIQVSSVLQPQKLQLDFLFTDAWTAESEMILLQRLHEVLTLVREDAISISINLDIDAKHPADMLFLIRKKLHHDAKEPIHQHKLSIREIEILGLIMLGYTNQEIADRLFISYETVKSHRRNILTKTGARNTAALINYYHQTFFEK